MIAKPSEVSQIALIQVHLFGSFDVSTPRGPVAATLWRSARARALFAYLAFRAGTPTTRETLLESLWPELAPETSQNTLHKAVYLLRQTIEVALGRDGKDLLEFSDGCYLLRSDGLHVDALAFKRAIFDGTWSTHLGDRAATCRHYEAAVGMYRGDLLEDDYLVAWAIPERERLRADYTRALRWLARAAAGEHRDRSAFYLRQLLAAEPCAEDAYYALIELALSSGRRGEALHLYRQCKEVLGRELGLSPSPELERLIAGQ